MAEPTTWDHITRRYRLQDPTTSDDTIAKCLGAFQRQPTVRRYYIQGVLMGILVAIRNSDAEVAIFAYGVSGRSAKTAVEAARKEGIKVGLFRPLTIWPFPEEQVAELSRRVKAIVVPELSLGQIIFEVDRCAKGRCKVEGIYRVDGDPINPAQILAKVKEVK